MAGCNVVDIIEKTIECEKHCCCVGCKLWDFCFLHYEMIYTEGE